MAKMTTVLVRCLNVSSDGDPVDVNGEECAVSGKRPMYTWEMQRRGAKWLAANPKLWKPIREVHQ